MAAQLFLKQASTYASSRPSYPAELFSFLSSLTSHHALAWDVGTGNGQAAAAVAEHYDKVIATDVSSPQLSHARKLPNIKYAATSPVMSIEELHDIVGPEGSVDLVTVAQALHWFDLDAFYTNVKHVLRKPGGVIAAWCYALPSVDPAVDAVLADYYRITDPYWAPQRKLVDDAYTNIPFPFEPAVEDGRGVGPINDFSEVGYWSLPDYLLYLKSWSALQTALDQGVNLLTDTIIQSFAQAWGEPEQRRTVKWNIALLIGRAA